jgi:hypothetical protein
MASENEKREYHQDIIEVVIGDLQSAWEGAQSLTIDELRALAVDQVDEHPLRAFVGAAFTLLAAQKNVTDKVPGHK